MNHIVCMVSNVRLYEARFLKNPELDRPTTRVVPLMFRQGQTPGALCNAYLEQISDDAAWVLFTTDAVEFLEDPFTSLPSPGCEKGFFGPLGARLFENAFGESVIQCRGEIGVIPPHGKPYVFKGDPDATPMEEVESLDSLCVAVAARDIRDAGLRFDPELRVLHVEDLCLRARDEHRLLSRIVPIPCRYFGDPLADGDAILADREAVARKREGLPAKGAVRSVLGSGPERVKAVYRKEHTGRENVLIYAKDPDRISFGDPMYFAARYIKKDGRVLDVGCSSGANGIYLASTRNAEMYGMEYDAASAGAAARLDAYRQVHQMDLNTFEPHDFAQYFSGFDHIIAMDVLEHVIQPYEVLQKLQTYLKPDGSFLISLPNLANLYPLANLLNHEFAYMPSGILDETHLRFFTWKSLARQLALYGFQVRRAVSTFLSPLSGFYTTASLPRLFYEFLEQDKHFAVCQYMCELVPCTEKYTKLLAANTSVLKDSVNHNVRGWRNIERSAAMFRDKVTLAHGRDMSLQRREIVLELLKSGKVVQALHYSGFFDAIWYKKMNEEVDFSTIEPLEHYLTVGWKEDRDPAEGLSTRWIKEFTGIEDGQCPIAQVLAITLERGFPPRGQARADEIDAREYVQQVTGGSVRLVDFVRESNVEHEPDPADTRLIAMYSPRFMPCPENDRWWGKGYTEWTDVAKAVPQFPGQHQPRLPHDLGFYDLRVRETRLRQEELARKYGVHGFCYQYYWFGGRKFMDQPLEYKLADPEQRLPFCLSWANEPLKASWSKEGDNPLLDQPTSVEVDQLFQDLLPAFTDPRYIRVQGRPFFMVRHPGYFTVSVCRDFMDRMRELAARHGFGLYLALGDDAHRGTTLKDYGADAFVELAPQGKGKKRVFFPAVCNTRFNGCFYDLPDYVSQRKSMSSEDDLTFRTVFPMWDDTALRAETGASVFLNDSPDVYADWLAHAVREAGQREEPEQNMVFINAWNEWGQGAHLEPDRKYGYAYLEKTRQVLLDARPSGQTSGDPLEVVSVFIDKHLYTRCVGKNSHLADNPRCTITAIDNRQENQPLSVRYNEFLNAYDYSRPAWLLFCHSDWELLEDPLPILDTLDKNCLYGPIGAIVHAEPGTQPLVEYRGQCQERRRDGSNHRQQVTRKMNTGMDVDAFDCQALFVHSSLVERFGLRFDERFSFHIYVEDFCITAKERHGVLSRIIKLECCHWGQMDTLKGREDFWAERTTFNAKYPDVLRGCTVKPLGGLRSSDIDRRGTFLIRRG